MSLALVGPGHMAYERGCSPFTHEVREIVRGLNTGRRVVACVLPLTALMLLATEIEDWPDPETHKLSNAGRGWT